MEEMAKVLVVDDEESLRSVLYRKLKSEGYDCEVAVDGKDALRKASMKDFALVLMDIKMPGMSGMEVLPKLIAEYPDTCVVMITAMVDTKTAVEAMKQGAYDFVTKPFDMDDLSLRVKRALERRKLLLENREYQRDLEKRVEQQVGQIRRYYQEALQALSREQMALERLEVDQTLQQEKAAGGVEKGNRVGQLAGTEKKLDEKLYELFGMTVPDSSAKENEYASALKETLREEPETQVLPAKREEKKDFDLYSGTVEVAILPPVSLHQMLRLHEYLKVVQKVKVLNLGGSVDKGITIRIQIDAPMPLIKVLKGISEVEKASDESEEAKKVVPARKGEVMPPRRVIVRLLKRSSSAESSGGGAG